MRVFSGMKSASELSLPGTDACTRLVNESCPMPTVTWWNPPLSGVIEKSPWSVPSLMSTSSWTSMPPLDVISARTSRPAWSAWVIMPM